MRTWLDIKRANLLHNLGEFRRIVGPRVIIMAVVKANAYGHGLLEVAEALRKEKIWFAVDKADEGIALRRSNIKQPILVMGYTPLDELDAATKHHLDLTVYNAETIRKIGRLPVPVRVHLKLETGTTRQGVGKQGALELVRLILKSENIQLIGASTHFANIEDTITPTYAQKQQNTFNDILRHLSHPKLGFGIRALLRHSAASAGTILFPKTHFDAVRIGISLYGMWPSRETRVAAHESDRNKLALRPALTWKTVVAQIKNVPRGTPISYGLTERVHRASRIAVLPVGYYDGYDRGLSSVGSVVIRGRRAKVMGRVCMNMIMVDATDIPRVTLEDEVVLLGRSGTDEITAEEIAEKIGTIPYEITTRINESLPRFLV